MSREQAFRELLDGLDEEYGVGATVFVEDFAIELKSRFNKIFSEDVGYREEFVEILDNTVVFGKDIVNHLDLITNIKAKYLETHSKPEVDIDDAGCIQRLVEKGYIVTMEGVSKIPPVDIEKVIHDVILDQSWYGGIDEKWHLRGKPSDLAKQIADALRKKGVG